MINFDTNPDNIYSGMLIVFFALMAVSFISFLPNASTWVFPNVHLRCDHESIIPFNGSKQGSVGQCSLKSKQPRLEEVYKVR